ncbi:MAG TPA: asparagine synthase (glutamine-hydrolyzing) [Patescibacteria group bacterium]|nr:asparagine synthase (glutamine-hydrolyzing) [Patescibacteria group bacterium]
MCGIAGFVGKTSKQNLTKMLALIKHRGPDGEGMYWSRQAGLGNRRLAIIDRKGGAQPQTNEDQTLTITFNGEIYNFQDVRKDLARRGHRFKTHSDTEVILHAYEQYGPKCLQELNGMFAFAIWDSKRETLFAARDRLGIKPFFFTKTRNNFLFASEIKSLLTHPEVKREVNLNALSSYLTFRYVPEPETIFENIYHLPAGHYLMLKGGELIIRRYWTLPEEQMTITDENKIQEELLELLEDAVRMQLMSEVPVGSYVSGGIDSALLTAFATKHSKKVKSFNVAFEDGRYDESKYATLVNKHLNLIPTTIRSEPTQIARLPEIIWYLDQPLADAAVIPTFMMSKQAKKHMGVVLSGDGADEIFAGYDYYKRLVYGRVLYRLIQIFPFFSKNPIASKTTVLGRIASFLGQDGDIIGHLKSHISVFTDQQKKEIVQPELLRFIELGEGQGRATDHLSKMDHLNKLLKHDLLVWLPGDLLLKTDRMTMAHGLEARVPFLDHRLVEFATRLPSSLKLRGRTDKYLERRVAEQILPKEIAQREKHGFDVPLKQFQPLAKYIISKKSTKNRGWFVPEKIIEVAYGTKDNIQRQQMFSLLVLEIWAQIFLDKKSPQQFAEELRHDLRSREK